PPVLVLRFDVMEGRECEANASVDEVLTSLGATPEQIAEARRGGHLAGLAADVVFASDASLSANAMAKTLDVPVEDVVTVWRLLGIPVTDIDAAFFSERDAELTGM